LKQEFAWASHLGIGSIVLPTPSANCTNYALSINAALTSLSRLQMLVQIPLISPVVLNADEEEAEILEKELSINQRPKNDPWEWWNTLRTLTSYHNSLCVMLEITEDLPDQEILKKWVAEPVRLVVIPTSLFIAGEKGLPVLPEAHKHFLMTLYDHSLIQYVIKGAPKHPKGLKVYVQYLSFLKTQMPTLSAQHKFEYPYRDYLQMPLQPLMDNLESQTYEVFEQDPIKYAQYELAVYRALLDLPIEKEVLLMVVGAGRGPLVVGSLNAAKNANRKIRIFAVEKNPNAVIT
jgi:protein arginine N-methyltransferase 5